MELMMGGAEGISAFPHNDDLFHWIGTVQGVANTAYEGMEFQLSIAFPANYPFEAPTVTFLTPCFHPNVDTRGTICLDILKEKWSAVYSASAVLLSIQNLLDNPNNQSPLNNHAALLWSDKEEYRRAVRTTYDMGKRSASS
ncbi:ubiquitin-conjugating enzyme E2 C [Angomonas deanei]|nr:ubiquitin-conjugating enzyme E2 C [Angomonas deanei]|eukprot:EPY29345.1 ubiquitin-conjugating enzyme E2 C [Angomonas deanei]